MNRKMLGMFVAALALTAQSVFAQAPAPQPVRKELQVYNDISKAVNRYVYFTIFDDVNAQLNEGVVTLTGKVTMPFKKDDIGKRVAKVDGVTKVVNNIGVLPVSQFDDQIRHRVARAIYGNANFWNFAVMPTPPIHVIVEHSRVTLTGVVPNDVDRALARSLATQFGVMSVTNDLRTDAEAKAQLEAL